MKKIFFTIAIILCLASLPNKSHAQDKDGIKVVLADSSSQFGFTLDAMTVINNKCYGCHSPNARGDKSKKALMWIELQTMDDVDLIAKLDEIVEVMEEGSMPPAKMIEKYPGMKMTDEEVEILKSWSESLLSAMMDE
jgi:uncharacterized membrane protein